MSIEPKQAETNRFLLIIKELAIILIWVFMPIAIYMMIQAFLIEPVRVSGNSMYPTLKDQDIILIEKVSYRFHNPERFDIIVFKKDKNLVKRVIGLPNETIQIIDGVIYVDDEVVDEYYGREVIIDGKNASNPIKIGDNQIFVMGDNRNNSLDSRSEEIGLVDLDLVLGKVCFRILPLDAFGSLTNQ